MKSIRNSFKNFIIFILLIIITFMIILKDQDINSILRILFSVKLIYVLIGIMCMSLYFVIEGYNIKSIIGILDKKIRFIDCLKYSIIGFFFSGITPAASGGQPMEIYFMHKDGIKVSHSTVALLVQLCSFQIITIVGGIIGALVNSSLLSDGFIYLFIIGISLNIIVLTTMMICLFSNSLAKKVVNIFLKILETFKYHKVNKLREKIGVSLDSYAESSVYIKNNKKVLFKSLCLVFLQVIAYYSIPFWVCNAFNLNTSNLFQIISMQALLFSSVSSIPLPGSVGISESVFLKVYNKVFGKYVLSSAMLLNRFINFYLFILIGAFVVAFKVIKLHKFGIEKEYEEVETPEELMEFMDNYIGYGIHGNDGNDYINDGSVKSNNAFQVACQKYYSLASPKSLLEYKLGHCWDQVELERDWFLKHNYEYKTLYIMFLLDYPNNYSTHTYLIYKDSDEYCLFEHADYDNKGIHRFSSYGEANKWAMNRLIESNKKNGNKVDKKILSKLHVFEYTNPKYGIDSDEFISFVLNGEDITNIIKESD